MSASSPRSASRSSLGSTRGSRRAQLAWTLLLILMLSGALALGSMSGCGAAGNRTVFVPESSPMRIGPKARFRVWVRPAGSTEWELSSNEIEVPEGWYLVPPSYVADNADQ